MNQPTTNAARRPGGRNSGLKMGLVTLGVLAFAGAFLGFMEIDPNVSIPAPKPPPSPNAMDDYLKAGALLMDDNLFDAAHPPGTSASAALTPAVQDRILNHNAPAMAALHQGLMHEFQMWPPRSFIGFPKYRKTARYLAFQRDVHATRGDWGAAMQTTLDGLQMGSDMRRGGGLIPTLFGVTVGAISRDPRYHIIDHLSPEETKAAFERIHAINANRVTLAQMLQQDEWDRQTDLMAQFQHPNWRSQLAAGAMPSGNSTPPPFLSYTLRSKRSVMQHYTRYMDAAVVAARARRPIAPYATHTPRSLDDMVIIDVSEIQQKYNSDVTQNNFLELQLALRAYKFQHGSYPETLGALTPDLETAIPDDPFAPGKPFHYQKTANSYVLYSVGPDGVDDGGKAIDNFGHVQPYLRRVALSDSKGDVVAGVNE
ncbi:MAG: hypothetical protein ABIY70_04460 [Capsulimonas sp.]|uniref:hypothetical protein n=1 Tax=Capsulimonas sp. TaxID=2494211 RepID=UPI00326755DE